MDSNGEDLDIINGLTRCWMSKPPIPKNYSYLPKENLNVLVISKPFDPECVELFAHTVEFLQNHRINIYSNSHSIDSTKKESFICEFKDKDVVNRICLSDIRIYSNEDNTTIDRVITLGGDGTILFSVKMFYNRVIPPLITFGMGSFGYLCCFDSNDFENVLCNCLFSKENKDNTKEVQNEEKPNYEISSTPFLKYKDRICISVNVAPIRDSVVINSNIFPGGKKLLPSGAQLNALNELTLETGCFTSMFSVELYLNDFYLTKVTASGLIFATPTGSTAYNMSAGGSIVETEVKALTVTPLNPHALSFRPLVLPFNTKITIKVPKQKYKDNLHGCIDGDFQFSLAEGDEIIITGSEYPAPFVTTDATDALQSWIKRLKSTVLSC